MKIHDILTEKVIDNNMPRSDFDYEDVDRFAGIKNGSWKPRVVSVNPDELLATQDWLDTKHGGGPKARFDQYQRLPVVYKDAEGMHILDGHHRTKNAMEKGRDHFKVYLFTDPKLTEASFASLKKAIPDYHINEWHKILGIPKKVLYLYGELGYLQRGNPEIAMVRAQHVLGGGVLQFQIEHVGDLTNRMSPKHAFGWSWGASLDKVEKCLKGLEASYGFRREFFENVQANAVSQNKDPKVFLQEVKQALAIYASEHEKLLSKCHCKIHKSACYAAICLGKLQFEDAAMFLRGIKREISTEQGYANALKQYDPNLNRKLAGEEEIE